MISSYKRGLGLFKDVIIKPKTSKSKNTSKSPNTGAIICEYLETAGKVLKTANEVIPARALAKKKKIKPIRLGLVSSNKKKENQSIDSNCSSSAENQLELKYFADSYYINDYAIKVQNAIKDNQIFYVSEARTALRNALLSRGWIEKVPIDSYSSNMTAQDLAYHARPGNKYEKIILSKLLNNAPINFIWGDDNLFNNYKMTVNLPYRLGIKRFPLYDFTNKEGLIACQKQIHWSIFDTAINVYIPRAYRLNNLDEKEEFLNDYRLTCCFNLLKFITESDSQDLFAINGIAQLNTIDFSLKRIRYNIMFMHNVDIDATNRGRSITKEENQITQMGWYRFCCEVCEIIKSIKKFPISRMPEIYRLITESKILLINSLKYWPKLSADGYNNLWILKPAFRCCGVGIDIKDNYQDIIEYYSGKLKMRYIVQKYIERPMLIYKTKFDIRQYILLSITNKKLNIWMYKSCYLRFSSQEFKLDELNRVIHITNNSVQRYEKNSVDRSEKLPTHNMWTLNQFKYYLACNNRPHLWEQIIYPQMKNVLLSIIITCLEESEFLDNTFDLYGADFLLDCNYDAHLLEINSSPDMGPTTCVTAALCPQVQEDLVKVIVDLPLNNAACTGDFELIYNVSCNKPKNEYIIGNIIGKSINTMQNERFLNIHINNSIVSTTDKALKKLNINDSTPTKKSKKIKKFKNKKYSNTHTCEIDNK